MADDPPTPPADLPAALVDTLQECSPDRLRDVARYADQLAEHRDRGTDDSEGDVEGNGTDDEGGDADGADMPEDRPESVPGKASLTTKEINGNRYHYWQWREGEDVKSKYKGPATPSE